MILLTMAWRNLWRNSKRSWITISAIASAFVFLIAIGGLVAGLLTQMLRSGTETMLGHIQVHDREYLPNRGLYDWIGDGSVDLPQILAEIEGYPEVKAASPRVFGFALVSSGNRSQGAQLIGVDPPRERAVTQPLNQVATGDTLNETAAHEVVIGVTLAKSIGLGVGDELAVVTQAADGSLGNDLYRVIGLLDIGSALLNRSLVLMHYRDLQELLALDSTQVHEIAVLTDRPLLATTVAERLNSSSLLPNGAEAKSWEKLVPQLSEYLQLAEGSSWFLIVLIGLFAAFGTLNTMAMAVYERAREIGHLAAMGMRPFQILGTLLSESVFLGAVGLFLGGILGGLLNFYFSRYGLDLSRWTGEFSLANSRVEPVMKAEWPWDQFLWSAVGLMLAVILATLVPAIRAARKDPVKALQEPAQG